MVLALGLYFVGFGGLFLFHGAWPIFGFMGLDLLLFAWLWRINRRAGDRHDEIAISSLEVQARRYAQGCLLAQARFQTHWTRVILSGIEDRANNNAGRLELASGRERFLVGQFLTREEKIALQAALESALRTARA